MGRFWQSDFCWLSQTSRPRGTWCRCLGGNCPCYWPCRLLAAWTWARSELNWSDWNLQRQACHHALLERRVCCLLGIQILLCSHPVRHSCFPTPAARHPSVHTIVSDCRTGLVARLRWPLVFMMWGSLQMESNGCSDQQVTVFVAPARWYTGLAVPNDR